VDNFEKVMAEGPNPKKKHLLHRLVKKVLIHSRQTIEIWYALPNSRRFEDSNIWLPTGYRCEHFTPIFIVPRTPAHARGAMEGIGEGA